MKCTNAKYAAMTAVTVVAALVCCAMFPRTVSAVCTVFFFSVFPSQAAARAQEYADELLYSPTPVYTESANAPSFSLWAGVTAAEKTVYAVATDNSGAQDIPEERRGEIYEKTYGNGVSSYYFYYKQGCFLNRTKLSANEAAEIAQQSPELAVQLNSEQPQVLIYHTHACESYDRYAAGFYDTAYPSRTTDTSLNMVSVGAVLAQTLRENGINCIQSETLHDHPSYSGSYSRSKKTILEYLEQYPSIVLVIDLHRDAITSQGVRYKPVAEINGVKAAQIMIMTGADDGTMNMPLWQSNLSLAARIQNNAQRMYAGLMRPAVLGYTCYNQSVPVNALLFEMGAYANSHTEALYSAWLLGQVLCETLSYTG